VGTVTSKTDFQSDTFPLLGNVFVQDTTGINEGYPIFYWQQ
jgi:hypothetical protein